MRFCTLSELSEVSMSCAPIFPVTTSLAHDVINNLTSPDGARLRNTVMPRGFFMSEAVFAKNLLGAMPIEQGSFNSCSKRC